MEEAPDICEGNHRSNSGEMNRQSGQIGQGSESQRLDIAD
jgi:hypothetical protein